MPGRVLVAATDVRLTLVGLVAISLAIHQRKLAGGIRRIQLIGAEQPRSAHAFKARLVYTRPRDARAELADLVLADARQE
jgi:hypothetical protein